MTHQIDESMNRFSGGNARRPQNHAAALTSLEPTKVPTVECRLYGRWIHSCDASFSRADDLPSVRRAGKTVAWARLRCRVVGVSIAAHASPRVQVRVRASHRVPAEPGS